MTRTGTHVITVRPDGRCGTCGRPVNWTAFRSKAGDAWDEQRPDERVVSFIRHWGEPAPTPEPAP